MENTHEVQTVLIPVSYTHLDVYKRKVRNLSGVGACPILLKSGSKHVEMESIIQDAIQRNAPAADSLALKNAASKLGKLFTDVGSDVEFTGMYSKDVPMDDIKASQQ